MALLRVRAELAPSPKEVHAVVSHTLEFRQSDSTNSDDAIENTCEQILNLVGAAFGYAQGNVSSIFTQKVSHDLSIQQSVAQINNFLYVQLPAHFELIVDLIWDQMKPDNKGWKTKDQLRTGLLAFMQSLPGN